MKKMTAFLLTMVMALAVVTGCGNGGGTGKVTLKIGIPNGNEIMPYSIVEGFKAEHPEIDVVIDEAPWSDFNKKLTMQIAAGNPSDVFITDSGYVATLGGMGAAMNLADRIEADIDAEKYTAALYAGKDGEGNVWGIPQGINATAILYNKTMFDEAGLAYPQENWTYQEMFDTAEKLTKDTDGDGVTDVYGFVSGFNITQGWLPFILSTGGEPLDETRTKAMFNTPESIEGLRKFKLQNEIGIAPTIPWISTNGGTAAAFYSGKVAMMLAQSGDVVTVNKNAPEGFKYDAQMMPVGWDGERHCVYVPNQWVVYSKASKEVQDAAWEWIKYFLNEKSQMAMIDEMETKPIVVGKSAMEHLSTLETRPDNFRVFHEGIDSYGVTLYENATWRDWRGEVDKVAADIYNGVISVEDGAEKMNTTVQKIIDENQ